MNKNYIITQEEIAERGLNLNDYVLTGDLIPAIINRALEIGVSRCCFLNDNFKGAKSIEEALDNDPDKVESFKKLQFNILWNLIFTAETDPVDQYIDIIIVHELGWGKINGFQKGIWYKNY